MKKQIAIAIGLAVLSTSALASKARLEALGQDANGSLYLEDSRSIFLNPAHLNHHKDFVTLEFGNTNREQSLNSEFFAGQDSASTPKAEGGIFKSRGNMAYGVYFGSESNTANAVRTAAMGADNVVTESNNIDFFIAGDAGIQWGARLTYGQSKNNQTTTFGPDGIPGTLDDAIETNDESSSTSRLVLGAISGDLEGYLNISIANKAEGNNNTELDGKSSFAIGAVYNRSGYDLMFELGSLNAEDAGGAEFEASRFAIGVAREHKLNDRAIMWASAFYRIESRDNKFTQSGNPGERTDNYLPIIVGMEVQVKDWLALRGSVTHELFGTTENDDGQEMTRQTTTVAAGASLTWGDLSLDGMIGNSDGANTGNNTATGNGTLRTDQLLSRVSLNYKF